MLSSTGGLAERRLVSQIIHSPQRHLPAFNGISYYQPYLRDKARGSPETLVKRHYQRCRIPEVLASQPQPYGSNGSLG